MLQMRTFFSDVSRLGHTSAPKVLAKLASWSLTSLGYRLAPQGAGRPIPNLFVPLANSTLPPLGSAGPGIKSGGPISKLGEANGDPPAVELPPPPSPTPNESRFAKKLLLAFVNVPKPCSVFLGSGFPNVNGNGAGMSTCFDFIGFGGGLAGDVGLPLSLSLSRSRWCGRAWAWAAVRADWNPDEGPPTEVPGRAYSSDSEAQYSAARVAFVISLRANLLKFRSCGSGASHMLNGGAARTLQAESALRILSAREVDGKRG